MKRTLRTRILEERIEIIPETMAAAHELSRVVDQLGGIGQMSLFTWFTLDGGEEGDRGALVLGKGDAGHHRVETLPLSGVEVDYKLGVTWREETCRRRVHMWLMNVDVDLAYALLTDWTLAECMDPPSGFWGFANQDICKIVEGFPVHEDRALELVFEREPSKELLAEVDAWLVRLGIKNVEGA